MPVDDQRAPVFVKVDDYNAILQLMDTIKQRLNQARTLLTRIGELKQQEDAQLENWKRDLDDVEERLSSVDRSLASPKV
jgi:tetrahydromethanopterin S-methyltransferase subunit G